MGKGGRDCLSFACRETGVVVVGEAGGVCLCFCVLGASFMTDDQHCRNIYLMTFESILFISLAPCVFFLFSCVTLVLPAGALEVVLGMPHC